MYELVTRHFLACVSADAFGKETTVNVVIAEQEKFYANGLMIIERNYLDVYPYEKWSDKEIPNYENIQGYYFFEASMQSQSCVIILYTKNTISSLSFFL